jgi:RimJ/RimL family protein N-acetyltransferase
MIFTKRIKLDVFSEKNISEKYLNWLNDKELMSFSNQKFFTHSYESCLKYLKSYEGSPHFFFAIYDFATSDHIGNINAYVDVFHNTADIGILLGDKKYAGKGYGLEAWCAFTYYLFKTHGIRKVTAGTMALNQGMVRIAERSGMKSDGIRQGQFLFNSKEVDMLLFGLHSREFEKNLLDSSEISQNYKGITLS